MFGLWFVMISIFGVLILLCLMCVFSVVKVGLKWC